MYDFGDIFRIFPERNRACLCQTAADKLIQAGFDLQDALHGMLSQCRSNPGDLFRRRKFHRVIQTFQQIVTFRGRDGDVKKCFTKLVRTMERKSQPGRNHVDVAGYQ